MWCKSIIYSVTIALAVLVPDLSAEESEQKVTESPKSSVAEIARQARPSVVVIRGTGRDGEDGGIGTGFIVAADGLIATNLHVIGESRPITVQLEDGKSFAAISIHAWDRRLDLALVKIDADGLVPLPLSDADDPPQGESVVAIGNPHGLEHSVVGGHISAVRHVDGRKMLQMAIPIEPGNSGGPLLDMQGRVQGIITMKSAVTANLGFAVPVSDLRALLDRPNPVPMSRWLTFGALDARKWTTLFGANWRQLVGRIVVTSQGRGFGGRSLCLSQAELPELPYELAVTVKLDDETGAAGLVFQSDGENRHYGFYPSNGRLRLSRFDGPTVFSWNVLAETASPHYEPGEWNRLKVRLEESGRIRCFVNDQMVFDLTDNTMSSGKVGLAKFRQTVAHFKQFQVADSIPPVAIPARDEQLLRLIDQLPEVAELSSVQWDSLVKQTPRSVASLKQRAKQLEEQATQMKRLAREVHTKWVATQLAQVVSAPESDLDLARAALWIAHLDNLELDIDAYIQQLDRIAADIASQVSQDAGPAARRAALNKYLFQENGYHGSRTDYYHRANSHLNRVIDDREGLPITLSVLYMELARRLGIDVVGVGLPGHFVVRHVWGKDNEQLIDVFDGGQSLTRAEAARLVMAQSGAALVDAHLAPADKKSILLRMLRNLLGNAERQGDNEDMLRYLDLILAIDPDQPQERGERAMLRIQTGRHEAAAEDLDWFLENKPEGIPLDTIQKLRQQISGDQD